MEVGKERKGLREWRWRFPLLKGLVCAHSRWRRLVIAIAHPTFFLYIQQFFVFFFFQNYPFWETYRLQIRMKDSYGYRFTVHNDESIRPLPSPPPLHQLRYTTSTTLQHRHRPLLQPLTHRHLPLVSPSGIAALAPSLSREVIAPSFIVVRAPPPHTSPHCTSLCSSPSRRPCTSSSPSLPWRSMALRIVNP